MSINVVVSSTAAGVSVSGGTSVAITVSGSTAAAVTVGGGIGPAGFLINPGTATNAFGTFQLTAGEGITISTSAAQFQIASYGTTAVSSFAPVQSVAGRVGSVVLQASDVTAGTFAIARIPTISYTALANVPATFGPSAHTHSTSDVVSFTAAAAAAAPVQSVAGRSGAVSLAVADISGLAAVASSGSYTSLQNIPATFSPSAHTHSTADITGFSASFAAAGHTHDAAAITSGVLELARIPTIGYTALSGVPASFSPSVHTHSTADVVGLTSSFSQVGHAHSYVQFINGLTGTVTIAGGSGVTVSTASSSITISAAGGGGGGSANIVEATTAAGFPATGSAGTLYHATDVRRIYFWDASSGVYVEAGTSGGTGEDTTLRTLFTPGAPTSVTATGGNAQAVVSWTAPAALSTLPITDYIVQRSTNSGSTWTTFTDAVSATASATVTGLTNGTAVVFRVAAVNAVGTGSYSAASSAVTPAAAPSVPVTYANRYGQSGASHSVTGTTTVTAVLNGNASFANADSRLWLLVGVTGTLSYTVTASSQAGSDGGRLYVTSSSPSSHGVDSSAPDVASLSGLTNVSGAVSGTQTSTGTFSVTAGQYLVLRFVKDSEDSDLNDRITATLSIA